MISLTPRDDRLLREHLLRRYTPEQLAILGHVDKAAIHLGLLDADLAYFARFYFPHYFSLALAPMHWELCQSIEAAIKDPAGHSEVVAWPRGEGKTTWVNFVLPLWAAITNKKKFILLLSDSYDQSKDYLAAIKTEAEDNERLKAAYGDVRGATWQQDEIVIRTREGFCRIKALGVRMKIRGRRYMQHRPDLIVEDDLENDENVQSPIQRKKIRRWHEKAVRKAGTKATDFFTIGTILHYDCLLARLLENPGYHGRKYKAVISWSQRRDLWEQWEQLYIDLADEQREQMARAFFEDHREEMLAGTQVAWPECEDYYSLMVQRVVDGRSSFNSEKQNEPVDPEERFFQTIHLARRELRQDGEVWLVPQDWGTAVRLRDCMLFGAIDPALGKNAESDTTAITDLLCAPTGQMFAIEPDIRIRTPDNAISAILDHVTRWAGRGLTYTAFGVEAVLFQEFFRTEILKACAKAGITLNAVPVETHSNKDLRIQSLQPDIENGYLLLETTDDPLGEQLMLYPKHEHDDAPDALEMARTIARRFSAARQQETATPEAETHTFGEEETMPEGAAARAKLSEKERQALEEKDELCQRLTVS
jgi:predicted phage terminase large subunit-like protein